MKTIQERLIETLDKLLLQAPGKSLRIDGCDHCKIWDEAEALMKEVKAKQKPLTTEEGVCL